MATDLSGVEFVDKPGGVEFTVKVVPGASRTKIVGVLGTALKVAVAAPPEGGKANAAVVKLLAEVFGVKRADVTILSGHGQPLKRVSLAGVKVQTARQKLRPQNPPPS